MKVTIRKPKPFVPYGSNAVSSNFREGSAGVWAVVSAVHSGTCTVDVVTTGGVALGGIPVASREWVRIAAGDVDYSTGERNLPPVNSRVFIFMPNGHLESAFVLCSSLVVTEPELQNSFMPEDEGHIRKTVYPGNWTVAYNNDSGALEVRSGDEKIKFTVVCDEEKKWHVEATVGEAAVRYGEGGVLEVKAEKIEINGNDKQFVTWNELNDALESFRTSLKTSLSTTPITGNGAPQSWVAFPGSIDISAAKSETVLTGG